MLPMIKTDNIVGKWIRNCPKCNKVLFYKNEKCLIRSNNKNKLCVNCYENIKINSGYYKRACPDCGVEIVYKSKRGYFNCRKQNSVCLICAKKKISVTNKGKTSNRKGCKLSEKQVENIRINSLNWHKTHQHPMLGKTHSDDVKLKISFHSKKERNPMYGKHHTLETKLKLRNSHLGKSGPKMTEDGLKRLRIKRIEEISISKFEGGQIIPSYNKNSCGFFDELNKKFGWDGLYAKNKGEYHIKNLGYFVDYYEPNLNLVIEWDEKKHYDIYGNLKKEDLIRETEIKNCLSCEFIRIKEWEFEKELCFKMIYENITTK